VLLPMLLQPLPILKAPFTDISIDFVEGLPNVIAIRSFTDSGRFSKYTYFIALTHPYSTKSVFITCMDHIYKLYRLPKTIVSDRDVFLSQFWRNLFSFQRVKLYYSTAYRP
jgi:hypothetical protein